MISIITMFCSLDMTLKVLAHMYRLVQSDRYCTKRYVTVFWI